VSPLRERARARAWTASQERVEVLAALSALLADHMAAPERALRDCARTLAESLGDGIVIMMLADDARSMHPLGVHHPEPETRAALAELLGDRYSADHGFSAQVLDTSAGVLIPRVTLPEVAALQPEFAAVSEAAGVKGFAIAPLALRAEPVGLVTQFRTRPRPALDEDDLRFLEDVGVRLAVGLESARHAGE
jgi:GAF domain-containing protein